MALNFNHRFGPKRVEVIVAGERISPDRAQEIIRRTDTGFQNLPFSISDYGRHVRSMLGFPSEIDGASGEARLGDETKDAVARWRTRWDAVDLEWLGNHQLLYAKGWCHADGTIALADELEDYPRASELLADCQRLATAFPDLVMHVAAWGTGRSILGYPLMDAPESPWPQATSRQPVRADIRLSDWQWRCRGGAGHRSAIVRAFWAPLFQRGGTDAGRDAAVCE